MFDKLKEITDSWIIAYNPTDAQLKLATERFKICNECDKMVNGVTGILKCDECGCPINKKIFSPKFDACPLHKWLDIEESDIYTNAVKRDKSLI